MDLLKKTSPNGNLYLQEVLENGPMRKYQPAATRSKMG
jgi:DNA polymerase-3 subunit epsilon